MHTYSILYIFLLSMVLFPSFSAGESSCSLECTFKILMHRHRQTISYLQNSTTDLLTEKANLLHGYRFSGEPTLQYMFRKSSSDIGSVKGIRDHVSLILKSDFEINEWRTFCDVNIADRSYSNRVGLLLPVRSSRNVKARLLDTLIAVRSAASYYRTEQLILNDLRELLYRFSESRQLDEELIIRKDIDTKIDSTGRFLSTYSTAGHINKRSIHLFKLAFIENRMQIALLEKRRSFLKAQIRNSILLSTGTYDSIATENLQYLRLLENSDDTVPVLYPLTESIDSLNLREISLRKTYDTFKNTSVKIGPLVSIPGNFNSISIGMGSSISFSGVKRQEIPAIPEPPVPLHINTIHDTIDPVDSTSLIALRHYVRQIEMEAANITEELKSGIQYSLPWLNDLYSRLIYAQINYMNLRYAFLKYKISCIHSLERHALREQLMELYSESIRQL